MLLAINRSLILSIIYLIESHWSYNVRYTIVHTYTVIYTYNTPCIMHNHLLQLRKTFNLRFIRKLKIGSDNTARLH